MDFFYMMILCGILRLDVEITLLVICISLKSKKENKINKLLNLVIVGILVYMKKLWQIMEFVII
jgi:hypothetical protein